MISGGDGEDTVILEGNQTDVTLSVASDGTLTVSDM